jgi:hypothetical protein
VQALIKLVKIMDSQVDQVVAVVVLKVKLLPMVARQCNWPVLMLAQ